MDNILRLLFFIIALISMLILLYFDVGIVTAFFISFLILMFFNIAIGLIISSMPIFIYIVPLGTDRYYKGRYRPSNKKLTKIIRFGNKLGIVRSSQEMLDKLNTDAV